jgi:hypothetical protein
MVVGHTGVCADILRNGTRGIDLLRSGWVQSRIWLSQTMASFVDIPQGKLERRLYPRFRGIFYPAVDPYHAGVTDTSFINTVWLWMGWHAPYADETQARVVINDLHSTSDIPYALRYGVGILSGC